MVDNASAFSASEYDDKITISIPFYHQFHQSAIDLVQSVNNSPERWLDTGCGTGTFYLKAKALFHETTFVLADPSKHMLNIAKTKTESGKAPTFVLNSTQDLTFQDGFFDVVTAFLCHHYMDIPTREKTIQNCYRMLKPGGILIAFENIKPLSDGGLSIGLKRWAAFQVSQGKALSDALEHVGRYEKEFFPISIPQHIDLMRLAGFNTVEILWCSYMQAGFYAIK